MDNLARDTTLNISATRRSTMTITGEHLIDNGYDPAFVAGMLANIEGEGNFGQFEGAGSQSYLQYFINNHNYSTRFSWKHIYTESNTPATYNTLQEIYDMANNSGQTNIFGLGAIQRTNKSRFLSLITTYGAKAGGMSRKIITRVQVIAAENELLIKELSGEGQHTGPHPVNGRWGFDLLNYWRGENSQNLGSEAAAKSAGEIITRLFVRPGNTAAAAQQRGNQAVEIFRIMMR
jgi:hypothetical protein